jgi:O-antigen ligase
MYDKYYLRYYLLAMLSALLYTSILTLLIQYDAIDMIYNIDESPYVHRVYLAGMLTFAYSYVLTKLYYSNTLIKNISLIVLILFLLYTLIIGGSRMGYISILVATFIVLWYKYKFKYAYFLAIWLMLVMGSYVVYEFTPKVKEEVDRTVQVVKTMDLKAQILKHDTAKRTSLTCRFEFWYYAYEMGKSHFPLGVGTGDGILELERYIGKSETKELFGFCLGDGTGQFNPHNMYLFMFMQFGLLGILVLLWMLYVHLREALKSQSVAFVVLIVTTMITLLSLSELFSSKFFIPFYGYAIIVMYLISKESKEDKTLIPWK